MGTNLIVELKLLHPDAKRPEYKTDGASGMDLCFYAVNGHGLSYFDIEPGERALCRTGIAVKIVAGWEGQIRPRSGIALEHGVTVLNSPGTIDSDYVGELKVLLINHGDESFVMRRGDCIAQIVFAPVARATLQEVKEFSTQTARGEGCFGSTDITKPYIRPEDGLVGVDSHGPNCPCPLHADYT